MATATEASNLSNAHKTRKKNRPKYLKCTQNSIKIFTMHFSCTRINNDFHSSGILAYSGTCVTRV